MNDIYIEFLYDYDQELGYTENTIHVEKEDINTINGKTTITVYGRLVED